MPFLFRAKKLKFHDFSLSSIVKTPFAASRSISNCRNVTSFGRVEPSGFAIYEERSKIYINTVWGGQLNVSNQEKGKHTGEEAKPCTSNQTRKKS